MTTYYDCIWHDGLAIWYIMCSFCRWGRGWGWTDWAMLRSGQFPLTSLTERGGGTGVRSSSASISTIQPGWPRNTTSSWTMAEPGSVWGGQCWATNCWPATPVCWSFMTGRDPLTKLWSAGLASGYSGRTQTVEDIQHVFSPLGNTLRNQILKKNR